MILFYLGSAMLASLALLLVPFLPVGSREKVGARHVVVHGEYGIELVKK